MFSFANCAGIAKRLACAMTAVAFFTTNIELSYANLVRGVSMCSAGNRARNKRQFMGAATAVVFLFANIGPSYANEPSLGSYGQSGSVVPTGAAAMLRLRIPFGSDASRQTRPILSLSAGTTWRAEFGAQDFAGFRYTPGVEAGLAFGGSPILRLGSIDVLTRLGARLSAAGGAESSEDTGVPNWVWWVLGTVVVAGVVVGGLAALKGSSRGCNVLYGVTRDCPPGTSN